METISMKDRQLALIEKLKNLTVEKISDKLSKVRAKNGDILEINIDYDFDECDVEPGDYIMPPAKYKRRALGICVGMYDSWPWFLHEDRPGISFWPARSKTRFEEDGFTFILSEV